MAGLPIAIGQTLKQDQFAPLLAQASFNEQLLGKIRKALPEPVGTHCLYCVPRSSGQLILYADSAVWAARLRFYQTEVRSALCDAIGPIASVQVRILLPIGKVEKPPPRFKVPAAEVLDQLDQAAAALADPELRRCVQRLARTLRRRVYNAPKSE